MKLNNGLDFVNLDDILVDLKLSPEVVEIPVPRYFLEERRQASNRCMAFATSEMRYYFR